MNWNKVIDVIQNGMILILILIVAVCILTLIGFDGVVGTGAMLFLTNGDWRVSIGISLATTGLLMALMLVGYSMTSGGKTQLIKNAGTAILVGAGVIYILDVCFDSLTADYLRYGKFVSLWELATQSEKITQFMFRALIGGLSTIGESLGIAMILGMPVLKNLVSDALPKAKEQFESKKHIETKEEYERRQNSSDRSPTIPKHRPAYPPFPGRDTERPKYQPKHRPQFNFHQKDEPTYTRDLLDNVMKDKDV